MSEGTPIVETSPSRVSIPSPCIGICEMDDAIGLCAGCARSAEEIDNWRKGTDLWRQSIWAALPERLQSMGIPVQRLKMTPEDILDFIADSIHGAHGTWVLGVYGGVGEFNRDPDESVEITRNANEITATTSRAALRFQVNAASRLLRIGGDNPDDDAPRAYCLAVHRSRVDLPCKTVLTHLGADKDAIWPEDRNDELFDIGLGRNRARFFVRTKDPDMFETLCAVEGASLAEVFATASQSILKASPTRVVETGVGRVEVKTPIPVPGDRSPTGPHTHLLPEHLAQGIDSAPGLVIPDAYAIGALFYPKRDPVHMEEQT